MEKHLNRFIPAVLIISLFFMTENVIGQIRDVDAFGNPIPVENSDTIINETDTLISKNGFFSIFKGEPGRAALYGLLIPSGGQIYNRKWWKVPIALGIDAGFTYVLINNRRVYRSARDKYLEIIATPDHPERRLADRYREQRNEFRKWSEYSWIWLTAAHLFTVADAYVDRHLMDFDISPDLSYSYDPYLGAAWTAQIKLTIPLNQISYYPPTKTNQRDYLYNP
jgi:hypothetical protein